MCPANDQGSIVASRNRTSQIQQVEHCHWTINRRIIITLGTIGNHSLVRNESMSFLLHTFDDRFRAMTEPVTAFDMLAAHANAKNKLQGHQPLMLRSHLAIRINEAYEAKVHRHSQEVKVVLILDLVLLTFRACKLLFWQLDWNQAQ